ncbi:uncharacterized protein LOC132639585 [Lycium barbarum]|uniref:uncharacterized protein LOC132639585 n=1 Tax=Lycium barbarum TaxID=112863 RepID=UPI00293E3475|nr:uncharacterized protein LOC132639585 [Lycium barbarum]
MKKRSSLRPCQTVTKGQKGKEVLNTHALRRLQLSKIGTSASTTPATAATPPSEAKPQVNDRNSKIERLQLIKVVLFGAQTYWAYIFILPKKIIKMIDAVCRSFSWKGAAESHLGKAAILKHLWAVALKKDSLWIRWINIFYIKNKPLESFPIPKAASWVVRKILQTRDLLLQHAGNFRGIYLLDKPNCIARMARRRNGESSIAAYCFAMIREVIKDLAVAQVEMDNAQPLIHQRKQSPLKELHDVISHNINVGAEVQYDEGKNKFNESEEEVSVEQVFNNVVKEADISPRSRQKISKKGKKQDQEQQITIKSFFQEWDKSLMVTMVYAKCDQLERISLWDSLYSLADQMELPWLVGGSDCIFKRLDRMIANSKLQDWFTHMEVQHLSRTGSDHAPLLLTCGESSHHMRKPFRFLKFWTEHESFLGVVDQAWITDFEGDDFIRFKLKLKNVKSALTAWSKATFGDIFKQLTVREEVVRIKEQCFEEDPTPVNRMVLQQAQAALKKYVHYEEEFWRQKSHMTSFAEGDRNKRYFHSIVNGRRKRLQIRRIQNQQGVWIEGESLLAEEACRFYQQQFSQEVDPLDFQLLQHVPSMVDQDTNDQLLSMPTLEEVKKAVFELSADSVGGPDGMIGSFYQVCWDIVSVDVYNLVKAFFDGQTLPKSVIHTHLVLIPKKNNIETFADMRPISLSNFINKVISRVVQDKLEGILPSLISPNQSGFVKGRCIIENVLLTQEVVTDIRLRGKPANVVLKLDMAKAYDRVSWSYLIRVLRKMGFAEIFIYMVWRLIANNWYSILLNGQAHGFFHSTRGVKQRDPLSPALFILSAEVLSRALNSLFENNEFRSYGMPKWSANLNHLAYADDTIIFSSANARSLELIMEVLQAYEQVSGQLINKGKRSFHVHSKVSNGLIQQVETITGFKRGTFPFTYLGCPVTHSRKRKADYNDLIKKVKNRLQTWKGRLLSFRGKVVLINNVLMSMPIHLLSAIKPPKCVINDMHKIFSRFFWNKSEEGRRRHWSSWLNLCKPKEEGGVGFRSLFDVSKALCAKLWWKFRTTNTLWANYMWIKYCKRHSPQTVQWKGGSQVWKAMIEARDNIEQEIWWEPRSGTANVWFEDWTKLGALYHIIPEDFVIDEGVQDVKELMMQGGWNLGKLQQLFPMDIVDHILEELHLHEPKEEWDMPRWMMTASGKFTVGTAWDLLRSKAVKSDVYNNIWISGVPFKISFFFWRLWKYKIPVGEVVRRIGIDTEATCYCCDHRQYETVDHLFVTGNIATKVWTYVKTVAGITTQFQQVRQLLQVWWNTDCPSKFRPIFKAIPMVTMWQIWKWRNTVLHGGRMSINKVIYEINMIIYQMSRMRFPGQQNLPRCIPQILQIFEAYRPRIVSRIVKWDFPKPGWYKCNSDGASTENPRPSSVAFCIRNTVGDLQYAAVRRIPDGSNLITEARALLEGLEYCVTTWETPWSISMIINDISRLRRDKEVR